MVLVYGSYSNTDNRALLTSLPGASRSSLYRALGSALAGVRHAWMQDTNMGKGGEGARARPGEGKENYGV